MWAWPLTASCPMGTALYCHGNGNTRHTFHPDRRQYSAAPRLSVFPCCKARSWSSLRSLAIHLSLVRVSHAWEAHLHDIAGVGTVVVVPVDHNSPTVLAPAHDIIPHRFV